MTVGRPEARDPDHVPPASPEGTADGPPPKARVRSLALGAGVLVGGVAVAVLLLRGDGSDLSPATKPERGIVCPHLQEAAEEVEAGNETAFVEAVKIAAREAELVLERSGQLFGRPEELALDLRAVVAEVGEFRINKVERPLAQAQESCHRLGRWRPGT